MLENIEDHFLLLVLPAVDKSLDEVQTLKQTADVCRIPQHALHQYACSCVCVVGRCEQLWDGLRFHQHFAA